MFYKLRLSIFTVVFLLSACNENNLPKGYNYNESGLHHRMIYPPNLTLNSSVYPDVLDFSSNDNFILAEQAPDKIGYLSYLSSDLFVSYIAYKKLLDSPMLKNDPEWTGVSDKIKGDSINYKMFSSRGVTLKNTSEDGAISRKIVDSLIRFDTYYKKVFSNKINYWIICLANDSLIGPLTEQDYLNKKKELKISEDLKLKFEK